MHKSLPTHWWLWLLFLFLYAYPLFWELDAYRLEYYDESRRAVSAVEMLRGESHWLVPTFDGEPDHWGTKPPLLIWLQTLMMALLGPSDLAVRLPSALAAVATIGLLIWFGRRWLARPWAGWLAGLVLVTSPLYIGNHGARSGDYDALLALWLTGQVLFSYAYATSGRWRYLGLAGLSLLLAGWTKGIAGCFFLPAIGLYFLLSAEGRQRLTEFRTWGVYAAALLGILAYYPLRESLDPGYLQLVGENELGGRYLEVLEIAPQPWYFYLQMFWHDGQFSLWPILLPVGIAALYRWPERRSLAVLLGITVLGFWAIVSASATKHFWYILPLLPPAALLVGSALDGLVAVAEAPANRPWRPWALTLLVCLFLAPYGKIREKVRDYADYQGLRSRIVYGEELKYLRDYPEYTILIPDYSAHALFYAQVERGRGIDARLRHLHPPSQQQHPNAVMYDSLQSGTRVLLCENEPWVFMAERYDYRELEHRPPCKLVEILGRRETKTISPTE